MTAEYLPVNPGYSQEQLRHMRYGELTADLGQVAISGFMLDIFAQVPQSREVNEYQAQFEQDKNELEILRNGALGEITLRQIQREGDLAPALKQAEYELAG